MAAKRTNSIPWQGVFAIIMFCELMLETADLVFPVRHTAQLKATSFAGQAPKALLIIAGLIIAAIAGIILYKLIVSGSWEVRLFFAYAVWMVLTRILNGDRFLRNDFLTVMDIMISFLMFASSFMLNEKQREKLLRALVIFYAGFFVVACVASLFITVTNTYLCINREYDIWIEVSSSGGFDSLSFFASHRLLCASWVYISLMLMIYAFIKNRNVLIRVLTAVCSVILFVTLPLFHSRTIQIVLSFSCGLTVLLVLMKLSERKSAFVKYSAILFITASAVMLSFFSYRWVNDLVAKLRSDTAPQFEAWYDQLENKADPDVFGIDLSETDTENSSARLTDARKISGNTTLTGRTGIWKCGMIAIMQNHSIAFKGSPGDFIDQINEIYIAEINPDSNDPKPHMHNMFMQVLMLTGVPGFIIVLIWSVLIVLKIVRFFFIKSDKVCLAKKFITVPLTGVLIWHLVEVGIFTKTDTFGKVFFILCGIFLGYYRDFFFAPFRPNSSMNHG